MKRFVTTFLILFGTLMLVVPAGATDQRRAVDHVRYSAVVGQPQWNARQWERRRWRSERRQRRHWRNTYGYRNYGQYRRTQVGNRRFRLSRQYYYRNGIRLSRYVRIYY